jgi:hypothetical protein
MYTGLNPKTSQIFSNEKSQSSFSNNFRPQKVPEKKTIKE